eukprot:4025711-Prymnesium_polylepis.1
MLSLSVGGVEPQLGSRHTYIPNEVKSLVLAWDHLRTAREPHSNYPWLGAERSPPRCQWRRDIPRMHPKGSGAASGPQLSSVEARGRGRARSSDPGRA